MDDNNELRMSTQKQNANPYADQVKNNEAENINTKIVDVINQFLLAWLDTKNFTDKTTFNLVGNDTYDADKLTVNTADIKKHTIV